MNWISEYAGRSPAIQHGRDPFRIPRSKSKTRTTPRTSSPYPLGSKESHQKFVDAQDIS